VTGDRPARRLSPLTPVVRSSILVVAVVASSWDDVLRGNLGPLGWVLLALLVAGLVYGTAAWLRTTYWIEEDELRVDTGVVSRQSRRIRVDRLQGIDVVQPFVARIFGLAEVRMDVAGGGAREGSLAFLPLREAEELRETLLERRDRVRSRPDGVTPDGAAEPAAPAAAWPARSEQVVARLDLATLLVSLLLSVETVLLILAAVGLGVLFLVFGSFGGIAGMVPLVLGFGLTQLRKLVAYYGFTVTASGPTSEAPSTLRVRRGLLERNTQTVPLARVQGVVVSEPVMWRSLGWARLDVAVAGEQRAEDGRPAASTVMPAAPREQVMALARTLLAGSGGADPDSVPLRRPPRRARWAAPVSRRFLAVGVDEHLVVSRQGLLTRRTHVVPLARVQSLQLHQGPWQRRLGLADLRVDSPPGPVKVRGYHRDAVEARRLLERLVDLTGRARSAPVS
jgi:putative membrane protein